MKGYVKYQTFDEYRLEGVGNSNIRKPYVLVKKELDTISVIKSNDRGNIIKYINMGEFWFYQEPEENSQQGGILYKMALTKGIVKDTYKKFIANDTIFIFAYFPTLSQQITSHGNGIIIKTKEENTVICNYKIIFDNNDNLYKNIRNIVSNYKDILPYAEKGKIFPNGYYKTSIKVFKDTFLHLYDSKDTNEPTNVYKLNSLGEFDFKNAPSVSAR